MGTGPSTADKAFATIDHHMVGGRAGVDVASGATGAGLVALLAKKGIGPFKSSAVHLAGGVLAGVAVSEGLRLTLTDVKGYATARLDLIAEDQQSWEEAVNKAA